MSQKQIRGAVIGYGGAFNMGKDHLTRMQAAGITPVAACDIDPPASPSRPPTFPASVLTQMLTLCWPTMVSPW